MWPLRYRHRNFCSSARECGRYVFGCRPSPPPQTPLTGKGTHYGSLAGKTGHSEQSLSPGSEMSPIYTPYQAYPKQLQTGIGSETSSFAVTEVTTKPRASSLKHCSTLIKEINNDCNGQAARLISTARLNTLLCLHLQPINLVVSQEPSDTLRYGMSNLGGGFPLRCFQRLSRPNIATQPCHWRDNWCTRGSSIRVLSYYGQLPSNILRPRQIRTELSHDVLNPTHVPL